MDVDPCPLGKCMVFFYNRHHCCYCYVDHSTARRYEVLIRARFDMVCTRCVVLVLLFTMDSHEKAFSYCSECSVCVCRSNWRLRYEKDEQV